MIWNDDIVYADKALWGQRYGKFVAIQWNLRIEDYVAGQVVARIPEGFRPKYGMWILGTNSGLDVDNKGWTVSYGYLDSTGDITFHGSKDGVSCWLRFSRGYTMYVRA